LRLAIAFVFVLVAAVAWAGLETHSANGEAAPGPVWEPVKQAVVKWAQLPDPEGNVLASQYASDYPFDARSADDFYCEDGDPISAIEWWGGYWNPGEPPYADYFVIRFYADVPGPPFSHPGDLLYEESCLAYAEDPEWTMYHYYQEFPLPFDQQAGNTYWVSVQAVYGFFTGGQWGWAECLADHYWNDEAVLVFPELGIPEWTPMTAATGEYAELAFALYADGFSALEGTSWSRVKALFR
jgi:hypothetical protein